jgi:hypothetical protein
MGTKATYLFTIHIAHIRACTFLLLLFGKNIETNLIAMEKEQTPWKKTMSRGDSRNMPIRGLIFQVTTRLLQVAIGPWTHRILSKYLRTSS